MSDMIGDSVLPQPTDLYRQFLLHPAVKRYTDAFQIETDPPEWLSTIQIADVEVCRERLESWWKRSRCLLLDRESRRFFVSTVFEVRNWLMIRSGLLGSGDQALTRSLPGIGHLGREGTFQVARHATDTHDI